MALRLEQLIRREGGHLVVNRVSLDIGSAELFVLLGPRGSGAGAVVRIAAGLLDALLQLGEQHLLLVPCPQPTPARALICIVASEPSKQDIPVAGRLLRHLGAEVTLLAVLPAPVAYNARGWAV